MQCHLLHHLRSGLDWDVISALAFLANVSPLRLCYCMHTCPIRNWIRISCIRIRFAFLIRPVQPMCLFRPTKYVGPPGKCPVANPALPTIEKNLLSGLFKLIFMTLHCNPIDAQSIGLGLYDFTIWVHHLWLPLTNQWCHKLYVIINRRLSMAHYQHCKPPLLFLVKPQILTLKELFSWDISSKTMVIRVVNKSAKKTLLL